MTNRFLTALLLSTILLCCERKVVDRQGVDPVRMDQTYYVFPTDTISQLDGTELLFKKTQRWDTSFVYYFKRTPNDVRCFYFETVAGDDYSFSPDKVTFWNGFTFVKDTIFWNKLTDLANIALNGPENDSQPAVVKDGLNYMIIHDSKTASNLTRQNELFDSVSFFLERTCRQPVRAVRK